MRKTGIVHFCVQMHQFCGFPAETLVPKMSFLPSKIPYWYNERLAVEATYALQFCIIFFINKSTCVFKFGVQDSQTIQFSFTKDKHNLKIIFDVQFMHTTNALYIQIEPFENIERMNLSENCPINYF